MKRYVRCTESTSDVTHIEVVFEIGFEDDVEIAASTSGTYKGVPVPNSELPSGLKDALNNSQVIADYMSFIESITELMEDYYNLKVYYTNTSDYLSGYFGALAKDDKGNFVLDVDISLRVSTHDPHRTEDSQKHKKERLKARKDLVDDVKLKPFTRDIRVNKETCRDYTEAYEKVDEAIVRAVEYSTR